MAREPAASRVSACATSVRITFPTLKRVARLFELRREHLYLAPLQVEHGLIAQQAHIRGCGSSSTCSSVTRNVARPLDLAFGLTGAVGGPGNR